MCCTILYEKAEEHGHIHSNLLQAACRVVWSLYLSKGCLMNPNLPESRVTGIPGVLQQGAPCIALPLPRLLTCLGLGTSRSETPAVRLFMQSGAAAVAAACCLACTACSPVLLEEVPSSPSAAVPKP